MKRIVNVTLRLEVDIDQWRAWRSLEEATIPQVVRDVKEAVADEFTEVQSRLEVERQQPAPFRLRGSW